MREPQTPAEGLRRTLGRIESELGKLGYPGDEQPAEILALFDDATARLKALASAGLDQAPERVRLETATRQLHKKGKVFLSRIGGASGLRALRSDRQPSPDAWWWYLDEHIVAQRRATRKRTLRTLAIAVLVLALLSGLYALFLMPDRATRLRYRHEQAAEQALSEGDLGRALTEVGEALTLAPGDGDLLVLRGVILDLAGDTQAAARTYDKAKLSFADSCQFLAARVQVFLLAKKPERALRDARQIVADDPEFALGHLLMGNANAALGNLVAARDSYARAAQLAAAADQVEIESLARVQLANLTLLLSAPGANTPAPPHP